MPLSGPPREVSEAVQGRRLGRASVVNMQMNGLMGLKRSLGSNRVISQCQIKASSVLVWVFVGGSSAALQLDSFASRYIVKKTTRPLSGCCTLPPNPANAACCASIKHNGRIATDREAEKSRRMGKRDRQKMGTDSE